MKRGSSLRPEDFDAVSTELGLPPTDGIHQEAWRLAQNKVQEDIDARGAAAREFRRHSSSTTAAMNGSGTEARSRKPCLALSVIACRPRRWISRDGAPSTGLLLLTMIIAALLLTNSPAGRAFKVLWEMPVSWNAGGRSFQAAAKRLVQ